MRNGASFVFRPTATKTLLFSRVDDVAQVLELLKQVQSFKEEGGKLVEE
jgi:hypothetical protein